MSLPVSPNRAASQRDPTGGADNLQLYYRSCVDMLVSFMLQLQHGSSQKQSTPVLQTMLSGRSGRSQATDGLPSPSGGRSDGQAVDAAAQEDEVHLVTAGKPQSCVEVRAGPCWAARRVAAGN